MSVRKFGVVTDISTSQIEKLYGAVRLEGAGWYIEVKPNSTMTAAGDPLLRQRDRGKRNDHTALCR